MKWSWGVPSFTTDRAAPSRAEPTFQRRNRAAAETLNLGTLCWFHSTSHGRLHSPLVDHTGQPRALGQPGCHPQIAHPLPQSCQRGDGNGVTVDAIGIDGVSQVSQRRPLLATIHPSSIAVRPPRNRIGHHIFKANTGAPPQGTPGRCRTARPRLTSANSTNQGMAVALNCMMVDNAGTSAWRVFGPGVGPSSQP